MGKITEILELALTISTVIYFGIFTLCYFIFLRYSKSNFFPRVNFNSIIIWVYFLFRLVVDVLFYQAFKKDPSVIEKDTTLEASANLISTIFSRAKWIFIYICVAWAEDERI